VDGYAVHAVIVGFGAAAHAREATNRLRSRAWRSHQRVSPRGQRLRFRSAAC